MAERAKRRFAKAAYARRLVRQWADRGFQPPAPQFVKESVLAHHSPKDATWVETGTFRGETAAFLSAISKRVYSIEPEPTLYAAAVARFSDTPSVTVINGTSEDVLPLLVPESTGDVAFWLDGHYSAGVTFKGSMETPIAAELDEIGRALSNFGDTAVFVDDIRLFGQDDAYPPLRFLVAWADRHGLAWMIEHDIFIAEKAAS